MRCKYGFINEKILLLENTISSTILPLWSLHNFRKKFTFKQMTKRPVAYVMQKAWSLNSRLSTSSRVWIDIFNSLACSATEPASFTVCMSKRSIPSSCPCKNSEMITKARIRTSSCYLMNIFTIFHTCCTLSLWTASPASQ